MAAPMIAGSIRIATDGRFDAMVAGDAVVAAGCRVEMAAMMSGDLIVEGGAVVVLTGMVAGSVRNLGGTVTGSGMVGRGGSVA